MRKSSGNAAKHIECINPKKNKWRIRWDFQEKDEGIIEYMEEDFDHQPTEEEIRNVIISYYNAEIDQEIISGFSWNGLHVWLSMENQFNYKAAFDAAVMSNGTTLPVKFKFGTDDEPVYHEFTTIEELSNFYYASIAYVQSILTKGWAKKDMFNIKNYEL